jgi:TatD DNase family protein
MDSLLIDSHAHLLDPRLKDKAEDIVKNLKNDGIECVVEISADPNESKESVEFATRHKNVYCTIGVHPIYADSYSEEFEVWAIAQGGNKKIVAFGECGLDFYHMKTPIKHQREVFIKQIKISSEMGLPLVVHSRDAFEDTFEILSAHKESLTRGILLHCFSYGAEEVERFKELDVYFAFGGAITYKNADTARGAISAVPRDRLIVETDCPYLAPVPVRGTVNEPKNVKIVAEHIAEVLGLTLDEVAKLTTDNAKRFYNIK